MKAAILAFDSLRCCWQGTGQCTVRSTWPGCCSLSLLACLLWPSQFHMAPPWGVSWSWPNGAGLRSRYLLLLPAHQKLNVWSSLSCQPPVTMEMETGSALSGFQAQKGGPHSSERVDNHKPSDDLFSSKLDFHPRFWDRKKVVTPISLLFSCQITRWQVCFLIRMLKRRECVISSLLALCPSVYTWF